MKNLSETRKADREKMAVMVENLAARYGWQFYRCEYVNPAECVRVHIIGPRGLAASIEFERHSGQTDNYCIPWHFDAKPSNRDDGALLTEQFGRFQGSAVNSCHRRKCTAFARGIETLLDKLEVAMEMANGTSSYGSAFMPPAKYIMKNHVAYHPQGAWHYMQYDAEMKPLTSKVMMPSEAEAMGLQAVSPIEMNNKKGGAA